MKVDLEKVKEDCIGSLKKGNEDASEGRMRANMANKHVGSSAADLFDEGYAGLEARVSASDLFDSNYEPLEHLKDDLWKTDGSFERARQAYTEEMEEVCPKNNEYHSEGGTELQFTIHHGRFIEVSNMTIDLGIIPLIGYQDGLLTLALVIGEKFEHYPCSESNYEALQAVWMKVRLTGL